MIRYTAHNAGAPCGCHSFDSDHCGCAARRKGQKDKKRDISSPVPAPADLLTCPSSFSLSVYTAPKKKKWEAVKKQAQTRFQLFPASFLPGVLDRLLQTQIAALTQDDLPYHSNFALAERTGWHSQGLDRYPMIFDDGIETGLLTQTLGR